MKFTDYFLVAFKNIGRQKLRSALTIFAVVIGATSVTIMLSLVTGAKSFVQQEFESSGALQQVLVTQATDLDYESARYSGGGSGDSGVKLNDELIAKIAAVPHVTAVSPQTSVWVFESLHYKDQKLSIKQTRGYEPNDAIKQSALAGRPLISTDDKGTVTLTSDYADKLGFKGNYEGLVNQTIVLRTQSMYTGEGADIPKPTNQPGPQTNGPPGQVVDIQAKVVGVIAGDGEATIYFPMTWAKALMVNNRWEFPQGQPMQQPGRPGQSFKQPEPVLVSDSELDRRGYDNLTVKVDNTKNVEAAANSIRGLGVGAATAKDFVDQQLTAFNILGMVLGGIGGIALLVAAIGVINTMVMAILERTREIGVMRACGATRASVRRLFTFEASLLGFWGGAFGLLVGYGLTRVANVFINKQLSGNGIAASDIVTVPLWLIGLVLAITTVIGMLAGLYPAARAARLNPVEALRYE